MKYRNDPKAGLVACIPFDEPSRAPGFIISITVLSLAGFTPPRFWRNGHFVCDRSDAREYPSVAAAHREVRYFLPHLFDECCIDIIPAPRKVQP